MSAPTTIPVNSWTHLAVTYDARCSGSTSTAPRSPHRAAAGAIQSGANPLWIGGNQPYGEHFQGLIDEVRVYSRAQSEADIPDMSAPLDAVTALDGLTGLRVPNLLLD